MQKLKAMPLLILVGTVHLAPIQFSPAAATVDPAALPPGDPEVGAILAQPQISLSDLFRLAELTNPALAAARTGVQAQAGRVKQVGLYPNPELTLGFEEMFLANPDIHKRRVELMQPLIIGKRRGAALDAARASLASADQQLNQARREARRRVHQLWANQLYFQEAEAALAELLDVANSSLEIARTRFDARAAPESQVTKAMLEVYELEVVQQQLAQDRVRGSAEFAAFFGEVSVPLDRLAGSLDPALDPDHDAESAAQILQANADTLVGTHPAYRSARLQVAAAEAALRAAKAERIPDLNLSFAYGNFEPINENYIEAAISLPLPLFDRNQGRVAETESRVAQTEYQARIVENNLLVALAAAQQRHQMMHEQLAVVTDRIVPAAERGLDQAQEAYRVGRLMFLELVDAQRTYTDVRMRTLELRRELALAEADLMSLLGAGPYADPGEAR